MHRRRFLALPGLGALGAGLTACGVGTTGVGEETSVPPPGTGPDGAPQGRFEYGAGPSRFAELTRPAGDPRGVVVVIHGGFWREEFGLDLGRPLAASLAAEGWAAWNVEYRRVGGGPGGGGGVPETLDDVAAAIDLLADPGLDLGLDLSTVLTLGHSAGGHLAAWAAGRDRTERWAGGVPVTGVVSQAGVLDLVAGSAAGLGGGAVDAFLGHRAGPADASVDPAQQVPLAVPVRCVHGRDDTIVPIGQSEGYVAAATAAGADATLTAVDGDHFTLIDPTSDAWASTLELLAGLAPPAGAG